MILCYSAMPYSLNYVPYSQICVLTAVIDSIMLVVHSGIWIDLGWVKFRQFRILQYEYGGHAEQSWYNIHKHVQNIWGGSVLDGQWASRKKGFLWQCEWNLYTVLPAASCSAPLFLQRLFVWRFAQHRVGNAVTLTSSIPILAFTTAHVFLANINWHNTTVLYAQRIYFYLNLCKSSYCIQGSRYISLHSSYTGYGQLEKLHLTLHGYGLIYTEQCDAFHD